MKKILPLLAAMLLLVAVPAMARPVIFHACSADGKSVTLHLDIDDDALASSHPVLAHLGHAYAAAAAQLPAERFVTIEGYRLFVQMLDQIDYDAFEVSGKPSVDDETHAACKQAENDSDHK